MGEQLKILICGDVEGNLYTLYSKVKNVIKKSGQFDFLFCVGNFFDVNNDEISAYKSGCKKVPLPTYILGPNNSETLSLYPAVNGCELAPDITYLGKRGVFVTNSGLTVAYVSGVENTTSKPECQITKDDTERVRNACVKSQQASFRGIDILLTSAWPANVTKFDEKALERHPAGSPLISKLAIQIKPRYHFFGLGKQYYERLPYRNQEMEYGCHFTRAIALANVRNENKEKWLFAMNLTPLKFMKNIELCTLTTNTTECPYKLEDENSTQQFFYDTHFQDRKKNKRQNEEKYFQNRNEKIMKISQNDCWFCLASHNFAKHLVISVGDEAYLTLAKGGLVWNHAMILPILHYRTYSEMPDTLYEEIRKFKYSLLEYYATEKKIPVFFDRNYRTPHHQIHVIPVPDDHLQSVKQLFTELAEEKGFSLTEIQADADIKKILQSENAYFYVEIGSCRLIHVIKNYFPLQFAREVLAHPHILNLKDRVEWRNIETTKEEEVEYTEKFKNKYKAFDFTLQ